MEFRLDEVVRQNSIVSHTVGNSQCGLIVVSDHIVDYYMGTAHTSSTVKIEFESFLDSRSWDESFGIRDIYLIIDECPLNCISCDATVCISCGTEFF
jgi:hypothetical protein